MTHLGPTLQDLIDNPERLDTVTRDIALGAVGTYFPPTPNHGLTPQQLHNRIRGSTLANQTLSDTIQDPLSRALIQAVDDIGL